MKALNKELEDPTNHLDASSIYHSMFQALRFWSWRKRPLNDEERFAHEVLAHINEDTPPLSQRLARTKYVAITVTSAGAAYIVSLIQSQSKADVMLKILATIASSAAFILSYLQWRLGRHEITYDKYYDRVKFANDYIHLHELKEAERVGSETDHLRNMRLFAQLDNLEYIIGKYELNFVYFDLVNRSIQTFRSECDNKVWFCEKVYHWIGKNEGEQVAKGYRANTRKAARYIVAKCIGAPPASSKMCQDIGAAV